MLTEVADGVWVRQSEWVWTNSIVVRADEGLVLVDPGIHGAELDELADEVERLACRWSPGSPPILTGTTCSGTRGSATCRATPPRRARGSPTRPERSSGKGRRRMAGREFRSS